MVDSYLDIRTHRKKYEGAAPVGITQFAFTYDGCSIHGEYLTFEWYLSNLSVGLEAISQ